jgi:hypothetical protein
MSLLIVVAHNEFKECFALLFFISLNLSNQTAYQRWLDKPLQP